MKKAFITGINGQDGSYLAEYLLDLGYEVHGMVRRNSTAENQSARLNKAFRAGNLHTHYGDLSDQGSIERLLSEIMPDEIYNIAAQSHVRISFDVPQYTVQTNALGVLNILEAYRRTCPNAKFYQASSSEMFGDNRNYPFNEESRLMPASPYACAKVFSHNLIRNYRESYGIHASSGILFNHESPRRGETFVTRKITMAAVKIKMNLQDKLYLGNLDAKRDWGFAGDYVRAMWLMLQQDTPDDYVISTGETYSVKDFLECVFEYAGLDVDKYVEIDSRLFRPQEVPYLLGDSTKAKKVLGWEPKVKFKELAKMMYDSDWNLMCRKGE